MMEYRVPVDTDSALDCDLDEDGGGCNDDDDETGPIEEKGNAGSGRSWLAFPGLIDLSLLPTLVFSSSFSSLSELLASSEDTRSIHSLPVTPPPVFRSFSCFAEAVELLDEGPEKKLRMLFFCFFFFGDRSLARFLFFDAALFFSDIIALYSSSFAILPVSRNCLALSRLALPTP